MSDQGPLDTFTETTTQSWGSRILGSIIGFLLGPLLVLGASGGLFWNEGRAVQTARSLTEGAGIVVDVAASPVAAANDGKLIHISGDLKAGAKLNDPEFGVTSNGVRMVRHVEMSQWREDSRSETRKNLGGSEETTTTYTYKPEWSDKPIDSSRFRQPDGHQNPQMRYSGRDFVANDATLGVFNAGPDVLRKLSANTRLDVDPSIASAVTRNTTQTASVADGRIYLGNNPGQPRVGDYRISYRIVPAGEASVVARQSGSDLTGYQTHAGDTILLAERGAVSAPEMFKEAQDHNRVLTWILRGVLAFIMFIGFFIFLRPLVVMADVVPFIGNLLQAGTMLVSILLTAIVAPIVIAIAWVFYRPLIALVVLAIGALLVVVVWKRLQRKRAAMPVAQHA